MIIYICADNIDHIDDIDTSGSLSPVTTFIFPIITL